MTTYRIDGEPDTVVLDGEVGAVHLEAKYTPPDAGNFLCDGCIAKGDVKLCKSLPDCQRIIWVHKA